MPSEHDNKPNFKELLQGDFPEMPDLLKELDFYKLGRAITVFESRDPTETKSIGYILPLDVDQSRHLAIFQDGTIIIIEPRTKEDEVAYHGHMDINESALFLFQSYSPADLLAYWATTSQPYKITRTNLDESAIEEINTAVDTALEVARGLKESRDRARITTASNAVDKLNHFLHPNTE